MITRLLRDAIVLTSIVMVAAVAAFYVVPGVPHDVLLRLGDNYSRLPLWPWAIAACLVGLHDDTPAWLRRLLLFQAASFAVLLGIEGHRAAGPQTASASQDVVEEWLYLSYYAAQFLSAAEALGAGIAAAPARHWARTAGVGVSAISALGLSLCAIYFRSTYESVVPSYAVYLPLNLAVAAMFFAAAARVTPAWRTAVLGLGWSSALFFATDLLDFLYYLRAGWWLTPGTAWDLLWTLPAMCFIVSIRWGRLASASTSGSC